MSTEAELQLVAPHPVAKIRGEPLLAMPTDLYIPPDALEVILDNFEGPLDLLLYLIRKANVDILDIPMAKLTAQYLQYVEAMRRTNLELAAEYLVMAAILIEIKSRMLLPHLKEVEDDSGLDPRAELVRRLLEYEQIKLAAQRINALPQHGRDFFSVEVWIEQTLVKRLPQVHVQDLENAWRHLLTQARVRQHHKIRKDELSVREYMSLILRKLGEGVFHEFTTLFDPWKGVPVLVVSFLAVLELARESLIEITQAEPFAPIYVKLAGLELSGDAENL
ncbi:MAG TPA: ScpA family protein [Burkholderiales bacterium]|nr:ScpA family protein [Burkholderiales bacterium]